MCRATLDHIYLLFFCCKGSFWRRASAPVCPECLVESNRQHQKFLGRFAWPIAPNSPRTSMKPVTQRVEGQGRRRAARSALSVCSLVSKKRISKNKKNTCMYIYMYIYIIHVYVTRVHILHVLYMYHIYIYNIHTYIMYICIQIIYI